jgi:hypothetical protein
MKSRRRFGQATLAHDGRHGTHLSGLELEAVGSRRDLREASCASLRQAFIR